MRRMSAAVGRRERSVLQGAFTGSPTPVLWSVRSDAADALSWDQKVPGGANWLPPAAPVAQGANS